MNKTQHFFRQSVNPKLCRRCNQPKNSVKHIMYPKFKEDERSTERIRS